MPFDIAFAQGAATMDTGVVDDVERPIHVKDREGLAVHFCDDAAGPVSHRVPVTRTNSTSPIRSALSVLSSFVMPSFAGLFF